MGHHARHDRLGRRWCAPQRRGQLLANITVNNGSSGAATTYRFDNTRKDSVNTGELGVRGKLQTGSVGHEWVATASLFDFERRTPTPWTGATRWPPNLYGPVSTNLPAFSGNYAVRR